MTPEEMQALIRQGENLDKGAQEAINTALGIEPAPPAPIIDPSDDWMFVPEILSMIITTIMPETEPFYEEAAQRRFAEKWVPVADKYGWTGASTSPEIGLGLAALGFAAPAFFAYKTRQQAAKEEASQPLHGGKVINGNG